MRLATFIHISDLHFGGGYQNGIAQDVGAVSEWFPGAQGHNEAACKDLARFFRDLKQKNGDDVHLILTGDLTSWGISQQFIDCVDFLSQRPSLLRGRKPGLDVPNWHERAIPGNHDYWPGKPPAFVGPHSASLATLFPSKSCVSFFTLSNSRRITFISIDTDADVAPFSPSRILARGSFRSQLKALSRQLRRLSPDEIRILLLHHSRNRGGIRLKINRSSRRRLDKFIKKKKISLLLTGHVHTAHIFPRKKTPAAVEARCGTTTQKVLSELERAARALKHRLHPSQHRPDSFDDRNTLLVHTLEQEGNTLFWKVETFAHIPDTGFLSCRDARVDCPAKLLPKLINNISL